MKVMERVVETIKSIAQDIEQGGVILREIRAQELRAVWTNTDTGKEYYITGNVLRRLVDFEKGDPRIVPVLQFIANQTTASKARADIERLERLKAFW